MEDSFKRKSPEEMLKMITKLQQGTLKIYIGPVSGSGKTYHMLTGRERVAPNKALMWSSVPCPRCADRKR